MGAGVSDVGRRRAARAGGGAGAVPQAGSSLAGSAVDAGGATAVATPRVELSRGATGLLIGIHHRKDEQGLAF